MPKFSSDYEAQKWKALQESSGASIKSIVSGNGTSADVQRVSSAVGQLSKLAREVFDDGVKASQKSAKAAVDEISKKRKEKGKPPLSEKALSALFDAALARALKEAAPPLLQDIHDTLTLELLEQDDRFKSELTGQFERFQQFLPKSTDNPSVNDMIALFDLNREIEDRAEHQTWNQREESLLAKIADTFKTTLRDIAASVQKTRESGSHPQGSTYASPSAQSIPLSLPSPASKNKPDSNKWDLVPADSPAAQSPSSLGSLVAKYTAAPAAGASSESTGIQTQTMPLISLSAKADEAIVTAAAAQTALHQQIVDALGDQAREMSREEEDDEKEPDNWFRRLKAWLGDGKKKDKDDGSWWETAAAALLLAMTDGKLFDTVINKIKEVIHWDDIKKGISDMWDDLYKKGTDIVNWVLSKLGLGSSTPDPMKDQTEAQRKVAEDNAAESAAAGGSALVVPAHVDKEGNPIKDMGPPKSDMPVTSDVSNAYSTAWTTLKSFFTGDKSFFTGDKSKTAVPAGSTVPTSSAPGSTADIGASGPGKVDTSAMVGKSVGNLDSAMTSTGTDGTTPTATGFTTNNGDTTSIINQALNNQGLVSTGGKTVSVNTGQQVNYGPSITSPTPPPVNGQGGSGGGGAGGKSPSQQVGLGSFGIMSGVNDSLLISNTGMLM